MEPRVGGMTGIGHFQLTFQNSFFMCGMRKTKRNGLQKAHILHGVQVGICYFVNYIHLLQGVALLPLGW